MAAAAASGAAAAASCVFQACMEAFDAVNRPPSRLGETNLFILLKSRASVYLSICLSVCLSVCPSVRLAVLFSNLFFFVFFLCPSIFIVSILFSLDIFFVSLLLQSSLSFSVSAC